tara:strand:- start:11 stop:553 length:543 start_codon:yes stop_codon:yes gene_type:complete
MKPEFRNYIFFLCITIIFSQKEYNLTSLIRTDGLYKLNNGQELTEYVTIFKIIKKKKLYLGKLLDGKKHGTWKEVYPDNRVLIENYKRGILEGPVSLYYKNGQKEWRYNYTNGILNGSYTRWYENGLKAIDGYFENGEAVGVWAWWDQNGNMKKKEKLQDKQNGITKNHNQYIDKLNIYN